MEVPARWTSLCPSTTSSQSVTAIGTTLMRNANRHDRKSTDSPPSSGPAIIATLVMPVQMPIALPWAAPRKFEVMSASELGTSSAPAMP